MRSIVECIYKHAQNQPDKTAIIAGGESITFGALYSDIKKFRSYLLEQGIEKGDRVIVKASHTISYAVLCYGVHAALAALVPVEKNLPAKGAGEIAKNVGAKMVISDVDPEVEGVKFLDMKEIAPVLEAYAQKAGEIDEFPTDDMTADILFTTGTTGKSKGVQLSHLSLMTMSKTSIAGTEMEADNVYLVTVPMNHAGGIRKLHMSMVNGSSIVMLEGLLRLNLFFKYIEDYGVTSIYLPPSAVRMVMQLGGKQLPKYDSQLRFIYTGSAAYPEGDKEKLCSLLPNVRLYNGYGGSEI
ncbi:MAG: AMP-binding protein, partial [Christensenellaceae bacterium]|nr:AMP-binding protein [Christensenellaceae bacterium]